MTVRSGTRRQAGPGALYLGIFATIWFSVPKAEPPLSTLLVVGLHFLPLAPVLGDPLLRPLGVAVCLVALAGLVVGFVSSVAMAQVVGTGNGLLLLGYAVTALPRARMAPRS